MTAPTHIERGRAPGGLVAALVVAGEVVDIAPLVEHVTDVAGVAVRHAGAALAVAVADEAAGRALDVEVVFYDGDTGQRVAGGLVL